MLFATECSRGGAGNGPEPSEKDLSGVRMSDGGGRDPNDLRGGAGFDMQSDLRSGGGFDLGPPPVCSEPKSPSSTTTATTTHNIPDPDEPYVFSVGGAVYSVLSFDTKWNSWTGTGWSESPIPWPAEIAKKSDGTLRALRFRTCNFRGVKELADGRALFMAVDGSDSWMVTFDGTAIRDPLKLTGGAIPCARSYDGRYYQLSGTRLIGGDPVSGWDSGTPVPLPSLYWNEVDLTALRDGRIVIAYVADPMSKGNKHVFILSKPAGGPWGTAQDITPAWAVGAYMPQLVAPRDGGLVVAATGGGGSYAVPAIWRSPDGTTFGPEDNILSGFINAAVLQVRATCLDSTVVVLKNSSGSTSAFELHARKGGIWTQLDRITGTYLEGAGATMLPDGRTFWGYAVPNGVTLRASM